jgi:hypothetical protein
MPTHLGGDCEQTPLLAKGSPFVASTDRKTSLLRDRPARRAVKRAYRIWVSDAAHHCVQRRIDLLFTMSDNLHRVIEDRRDTNSSSWTSCVVGSPSRSSRLQPAFALRAPARQPSLASRAKAGGARRDRTDDLLLAKQALSQLSYGPGCETLRALRWWAWEDSNFRPHAYQARALTN